jgi:nucleoside-diphosphate-sugar epimerase
MSDKIFVTGATGLVGFHVVKTLLSGGLDVVANVRCESKAAHLRQLKGPGRLSIAVSDIAADDSLSKLMSGCSAVIHCAGSVDMQASRQAIFAVNVDATRKVLQAAVICGARQFIHISSLSVITGHSDQYNVDETAPTQITGEPYADSKVAAEELVRAEGQRIAVTILRPGFIYGPGERAWMPRLIANIKAGKAMLVDGGIRSTNVIYAENLSRAVKLALFNSNAYGQTYNLTDEKTPTKKELFDAICDGLGLPRVSKSMPRPIVKAACNVVAIAMPFLSETSKKNLSRFSSGAFRLAAVNQGFSIEKARRELGYVNCIPFAEGMAATLKQLQTDAGCCAAATPPPAVPIS